MSGFTQQAFEKKLNDLNSSQQSIQTLSLWLIHHRKHYKVIVQTWFKDLKKAKPSRKLTFMYLANDVIQNSKKKGPEFAKEFLSVLKFAFEHISKDIEQSTLNSLDRLLKIWDERNIYDKNSIKLFRQALHLTDGTDGHKVNNSSNKESESVKLNKKRENEDITDNARTKKIITDPLDSTSLSSLVPKIGNLTDYLSIDLENYEKVEPEILTKALKDLENCASADASVRQKIANLPPEVFDVKLIENVINNESSEQWTNLVEDAQNILASYNARLAQELQDRKQLAQMLVYFIEGQRRSLSQAEQKLNEYRDKLRKVISVREELKSHLQNLPDLSQLPTVTPLPSALDLFKL